MDQRIPTQLTLNGRRLKTCSGTWGTVSGIAAYVTVAHWFFFFPRWRNGDIIHSQHLVPDWNAMLDFLHCKILVIPSVAVCAQLNILSCAGLWSLSLAHGFSERPTKCHEGALRGVRGTDFDSEQN